MRRGLLAFTTLLAAVTASAQTSDDPIARARTEPESGRVTVGQPITLTVEVLVPSFFRGAPKFPPVDVRGALTIFEDRGVNFTESIDGETWAGQSRRYVVYPQHAGRFEIESIPVEVVYQGADGPRSASPSPVRFEAVLPPGAEGLSYFIATTKLELTRALDPLPDTLKVGDAFTATTTVTVHDALSMVLPPHSPEPIRGLAVYPDPPIVRDAGGERGEAIVGTRIETVTWVAEEPGEYRLPPAELTWWDVAAERARKALAPAVEFVVVAAPATEPAIALPPDELDDAAAASTRLRSAALRTLRRSLPVAAIVALIAWLAIRFVRRNLPRWRQAAEERRRREAESERTYFRRFETAGRDGDANAAWRTLTAWIDRTGAATTVRELVEVAKDEALAREVGVLDTRLFGRSAGDGPWIGTELVRSVTKVRRDLNRRARPMVTILPDTLNPRGAASRD